MDKTWAVLIIAWSVIAGIEGSQYKIYKSTQAIWNDVSSVCSQGYTKFAKIDTEADQRTVETLLPYVSGFFWIGLKGQENSDKFVWWDGTEADYTNWARGFPGTVEGHLCVRIRDFDYKWETFNCSVELQFLCEDPYYQKSSVVGSDTKIKGVFMGLGIIGGLLLLLCLLLQLPCCRANVTDKMANIGFGTRTPDREAIFS